MFNMRAHRTVSLLAASTAMLSVAACNAVAAYARSARPTTTVFGAPTSQEWPLLLEVNTARSVITRAQVVLNEQCQSGHTAYGIGSGDKGIAIKRTGSFSDSYTAGPLALPEGATVTYSDQISGTFNKARTRITGTWHEASTFTMSNGTTDTCDSGKVAFTAVD
jgi:hypothetical protein